MSYQVYRELLRETNLLLTQLADGVLGLSPKEHRFSNFISHLRNNSLISRNLFTLCLSSNSGLITIGGVNNSLHYDNHEIGYLDYKADNLYKIQLRELIFADFKIKTSIYGGLDTGSTNTFFPRDMFEEFFIKLKEYCSSPLVCFAEILKINEEICFIKKKGISLEGFYSSMPIFEFKFKDFSIKWEPKSYLYDNKEDEFCLGIHKWE